MTTSTDFFFNQRYYFLYCAGRLAMPLFAFVFAYNLAPPENMSLENYSKTFQRLIFFGLLATPAYIAMRHLDGLLPLNIMFTFFVALTVLYFYEKGQPGMLPAFGCLLIGGILVEYSWAGIILVIAFWCYCKKQFINALIFGLIAYSLLNLANDNNYGLAALVIIILATQVDLKIPRWRYLFWVYYPLHLTLFYVIKRLIIQ